MEISIPLKIENKIIFGRDKLWLIEMTQKHNTLFVKVEFDIQDVTMQRELVFENVMYSSSHELDTFEASTTSSSWLISKSNFEEIDNSILLLMDITLRSDYKKNHFKHYRISTYDYIIEVISERYTII